jgi:hypothetical protein
MADVTSVKPAIWELHHDDVQTSHGYVWTVSFLWIKGPTYADHGYFWYL